jgi:hypothetical protein
VGFPLRDLVLVDLYLRSTAPTSWRAARNGRTKEQAVFELEQEFTRFIAETENFRR